MELHKTDDNPADLPSRGLTARDLKESKLWWYGAQFLQYEAESCPRSGVIETTSATNEMKKKKSEKKTMGYKKYLSGRYFITELRMEIRTYKIFILVKTC